MHKNPKICVFFPLLISIFLNIIILDLGKGLWGMVYEEDIDSRMQ
jgi:hypothetical protein